MKETQLQVELIQTPKTYGFHGVLCIMGPPPTSATLYNAHMCIYPPLR